ncbi:MAG: glycosyl transferase family 2, partial [Ruminiclostridium sp.]|nr:glycosyl transferase family 2 [Ruminiclostridium sp.]
VHYLGREYYFHRRWAESEAMLKRHLALPTSTWADERCASMRLLAKVCLAQNRTQEAEQWLFRAVGEAPNLREPWMDLATLAYQKGDWEGVLWLAGRLLAITNRPVTYITEPYAWGEGPWDLASLGYYHTGQYEKAVEAAEKALSFALEDARIQGNLAIMKKAPSPRELAVRSTD